MHTDRYRHSRLPRSGYTAQPRVAQRTLGTRFEAASETDNRRNAFGAAPTTSTQRLIPPEPHDALAIIRHQMTGLEIWSFVANRHTEHNMLNKNNLQTHRRREHKVFKINLTARAGSEVGSSCKGINSNQNNQPRIQSCHALASSRKLAPRKLALPVISELKAWKVDN